MELFISKFGYFAIVIGTFFEGEAILIIGGFFAARGYLHPVGVMIAAFLGALAGDLASYLLGSTKPRRFLRAIGILRRHEARARRFFQKYGPASLVFGRFFYGLRIAGGFVCGLVGMPMRKFVFWAIIGCCVWAIVIGSLGYAVGHGAQLLLGDIRRYEMWFLAGMLALGAVGWLAIIWRERRRQAQNATSEKRTENASRVE